MVCLLCGEAIGMVRKLKDTKFCCNEHREQWTDSRDRVLMDRLAQSQVTIERARQRFLARRNAPVAPLEPPYAHFLLAESVAFSGQIIATTFGVELSIQDRCRKPALSLPSSKREIPGRILPDLPWPARNVGVRTFGCLDVDALICSTDLDYVRTAAQVLGSWKPMLGATVLPYAGVTHVRRPDVAGRRPRPRTVSAATLHKKPDFSALTVASIHPHPNECVPA